MMGKIKFILFDAANTLIHKPQLWDHIQDILRKSGYQIPYDLLKRNHKLLSESIHFPDKTSDGFYRKFNAELLYSLGIIPTNSMLDEIFQSCTYLAWEKFQDTDILNSLPYPKGILSNFNSGLASKVHELFENVFTHVIASEVHGISKPDQRFYELALSATGLDPAEILYIGDSIKLDMEPAQMLGFQTLLIDRDQIFPFFIGRIVSLKQIPEFIIQ